MLNTDDITRSIVGHLANSRLRSLAFAAFGIRRTPRRDAVRLNLSAELNAVLAPTVEELEAVRADVLWNIVRRAIVTVPLGAAGGLAYWFVMRRHDGCNLLVDLLGGCSLGLGWAAARLRATYRTLYKTRVLPQLAARFGNLVYRPAQRFGFDSVARYGIFKDSGALVADDQIAGTYRNLQVRITEVSLTVRQGPQDEPDVFDGLLTEIVLPRHLVGTTVVAAEETWRESRRRPPHWDRLERVLLENSTFEQCYVVYASDQVQARALLTPEFIERLLALAAMSRFQLPGILAEGNRLQVALPKRWDRKLFEPPGFLEHAGGTALAGLAQDIEAVLSICDSVIALDFFAHSAASGPLSASRAPAGGGGNGGHAVSAGTAP